MTTIGRPQKYTLEIIEKMQNKCIQTASRIKKKTLLKRLKNQLSHCLKKIKILVENENTNTLGKENQVSHKKIDKKHSNDITGTVLNHFNDLADQSSNLVKTTTVSTATTNTRDFKQMMPTNETKLKIDVKSDLDYMEVDENDLNNSKTILAEMLCITSDEARDSYVNTILINDDSFIKSSKRIDLNIELENINCSIELSNKLKEDGTSCSDVVDCILKKNGKFYYVPNNVCDNINNGNPYGFTKRLPMLIVSGQTSHVVQNLYKTIIESNRVEPGDPQSGNEQELLINEILSKHQSYKITRKDLQTLQDSNFLNDEVINCYMSLIHRTSLQETLPSYLPTYSFPSQFYKKLSKTGYDGVASWTKNVDIFLYKLIMIPIHIPELNHWSLAVIDIDKQQIRYYDSKKLINEVCLEILKFYICDEYQSKKRQPMDVSEWEAIHVQNIPQQENNTDCGVFICKYAEFLSFGIDFTFDQSHMPHYRRDIYNVLSKELN